MLRSLWIALAMYSRLPAPRVDWDQKSLSWAMCFFPVVGLFIALLLVAYVPWFSMVIPNLVMGS